MNDRRWKRKCPSLSSPDTELILRPRSFTCTFCSLVLDHATRIVNDSLRTIFTWARFPFKRNRLRCVRCVRCVNENRKKRKRQPIGMLGRSSGNHDWLLANASACVSCGFRLRNASDCVWMETGLYSWKEDVAHHYQRRAKEGTSVVLPIWHVCTCFKVVGRFKMTCALWLVFSLKTESHCHRFSRISVPALEEFVKPCLQN